MREAGECLCGCHRDGSSLLHCISCCSLCYKHFIMADGTVDNQRLQDLIAELKAPKTKRKSRWKK